MKLKILLLLLFLAVASIVGYSLRRGSRKPPGSGSGETAEQAIDLPTDRRTDSPASRAANPADPGARPPGLASPASASGPADARARMGEADRAALADARAPVAQKVSALMRLATQRDPAAKQKALALLAASTSSPASADAKRLNFVAIRALGYFDDDESNAGLQALLKSPDPLSVRMALQALSQVTGPGASGGASAREGILKEFASSAAANSPEGVLAWSALYRGSRDARERAHSLDELAITAEKAPDVRSREMALGELSRLSPADERVGRIVSGILTDPHASAQLKALAQRHQDRGKGKGAGVGGGHEIDGL